MLPREIARAVSRWEKIFAQPHIDLPNSRPSRHITRSTAESSWSGNCKSRWIDPLGDCGAARRSQRDARHEIWPLIVRVAIGYGGGAAIDRDVHRKARVRGDNRCNFPS